MSGKIKLNDSSDSDVINTSLYCLPESATFNSEGNIKSHAELGLFCLVQILPTCDIWIIQMQFSAQVFNFTFKELSFFTSTFFVCYLI